MKRNVGGVETWQVYGVGGGLIAEYAANTAASSPQKEYGYRNGQLLVTVSYTASSGGSAYSFTDDPLVAGTTTAKATHLNELRTAVNQARAHAGLSAATWAESITAGSTTIKASHITELRTKLDEARSALGLSAASYTDATLTAGSTTIKAAHISELRTKTNEALTASGSSTLDLRWLVSDQLGTPRIILDQSGSLAATSRHDYLPFGEELFAGTGGRTTAQGYSASDGIRQHFTLKERDNETGLDYFGARYYGSNQGRFTSVDPIMVTPVRMFDPQQFNLYSYTRNNPLKFIDDGGRQTKKPEQAKPTLKVDKPTVTRTTYDVTGATANDAIKASNKHEGFAGETTPVTNVHWEGSFSARPQRNGTWTATVIVKSIEVSTTITVDTPNWVDAAKAPEAEQKSWNAFSTSLNQHEDGHVAIDTQGAADIGNAVVDASSPVQATGKTSQEAINNAKAGVDAEVNKATDAAVKEVNKRNQEYDDKTDHGRKKPQDE